MEYKFVPKSCNGEGDFSGHVLLKGWNFEAKAKFLSDMADQGNSLSSLADGSDPDKAIKVMTEFVRETKSCWAGCEITDKSNGLVLRSFDDVASYPPAQVIMNEVVTHFMGGDPKGN